MARQFPSPDRVRELLRARIDVCKRGVGGIIGVVEPSGAFTIAHGRSTHGASAEITTETVFGLGCVSKVLTGLLCAEMLERGEIRLSDRLADYLPSDVATVGRNGVAITLEHLVTHKAGLPTHEPDNFSPIDRIYQFVREYVPRHDVGLYYQYSTVGFSLLGLALARRAGSTHANLILERVCAPLGMVDTYVDVPAAAASRLAVGHDAGLVPVPIRPVFATGGFGFHSTASDLMRLLSACSGNRATPLDAAIRRTMSARWAGPPGIADIAMAWHVGTLNGVEMFSHDGISSGHHAFLGVTPALGRGVVTLVNGIAPVGLTDIGRHLLNVDCPLLPDDFPLLRPARSAPPPPSAVPSHQLESYVGLYQLTPRVCVEVVRNEAGLHLKLGTETQQIFPRGEDEFWMPASRGRLDGVVRFERAGNRVAAMIVAEPARSRRLMRVVERSARVWHGHSASEASVLTLERYLGRYRFGDYVLNIMAAEQSLCAVWTWAGHGPPTGLDAVETGGRGTPLFLAHERDHRFIVDADDIDAALTFELNGSSHADAVWCEMEQRVERGVRIPAMVA